ncbi:MAG: malto-oligosyltrehalose synthase [Sulfuricella sp.]|nr:malto-oligosyltrehalose synthase [Sulfuricella sp.]
MTRHKLLDRLCALYGIQLEYADIWGNRHAVSDQSKHALLAAMGVAAQTLGDVRRALQAFEADVWHRPLPPVQVMRESGGHVILTLPARRSRERLRWALVQEDGRRFEGEVVAAELDEVERHKLGDATLRRYAFPLPHAPDIGYHRFELGGDSMSLIVAPASCYRPDALAGDGRVWGPSAQLYALRSQRNWGIGDFGDLKALVQFCGEQGAGVAGVNPLHALFPDNPEHACPYGPSSRLFLDVLYLDVEAIADFAECETAREAVNDAQFQAQLRALRAEALVRYTQVAAAKFPILERLYRHFREHHLGPGSERASDFRAFQARRGEALRRHALYEALQGHFRTLDAATWGWPAWPEAFRDPASSEVAAFHSGHLEQVEFYEYLQWQASLQLRAAGRHSRELGLGVGLLFDLSVGVSRGGADVWADQPLFALGAGIGAPPDDFSMHGQDWGLPPFIPYRLRAAAYAPFIAILRECMRDAGALRIDHVMGLMRLFWVPSGRRPADGAYVSYPIADLLGILALESRRNRCLVVGEDLGTVPDMVREALESLGVLSYRLLYFEKGAEGSFKAPADYPARAVAAVGTHDLPTLAGFWQGTDLDLRSELGLFPSDAQREAQIVGRAQERAHLLVALEREGLLPAGVVPNPVSVPEMNADYIQAVYAYLARSPAKLALVQLEDMFGQLEQANLPGTTDLEYPSWRRKLPLNLEEWRADSRVAGLVETMKRERGVSVQPPAPPISPETACPAPRIPRAAYRLQFNRDFTFRQAAELAPYLDALGISHCYASPYLKARPGSSHGYDIIDHNALNPEIGSPEDFDAFVAALHERGMGQILDMVPNHMGVMGADNAWWLDVLENGPASAYARFFDIDWFSYKTELQGKVLLPVLGDHYGVVLENGELRLAFDRERGSFSVHYAEHRFPVDPREYPHILARRVEALAARLAPDDPNLSAFQSLVTACGHLPARSEASAEQVAERQRDKELLKRNLAAVCAASPDIGWYIEENVREYNGTPGVPASYGPLHDLIEAQAYRLAYWRVAADEINYRRFFNINDLAALRMEDPLVFETTHRLVFELIAQGKVDGLRIDHPDGLYDPAGYFGALQGRICAQVGARPLFLLIEKIVAHFENLPAPWPVYGTTGYQFLNLVNGLMIRGSAAAKLTRTYRRFADGDTDYEQLVYGCKRLIMKSSMSSELNVLANQLSRIAEADIRTCDFTLNGLRFALAEIVAAFPIYRTYVTGAGPSREDARYVDLAVTVAKRRNRAGDTGIFDFVREVLLTSIAAGKSDAYREAVVTFAMKFQQYTAPVMAKGLEDTAFYLYNRLVSLNEVGGDPRNFGVPLDLFHRACLESRRDWPHTLLATSTHDSKRSEDVRARIDVLSEIPVEWDRQVRRWARLNRPRKGRADGRRVPSANDEYLLYQTLLGTWPLEGVGEGNRDAYRERIEAYMLKAAREAKVNTSWINPNADYEQALTKFVGALLTPPRNGPFLDAFLPLQARVARLGMFSSLSQALLKLTAPGIPDIYPGCELWDYSLVDPDNRHPVDFALRRELLAQLQSLFADDAPEMAGRARGLLDAMTDGRAKLYLIWRALKLRREQEALFRDGDYLPLAVEGERAEHLCAYARQNGEETVIVAAPRWFAELAAGDEGLPLGSEVWGDTRIEAPFADAEWVNVFTGETVAVHKHGETGFFDAAKVFGSFPCALLVKRGSR